MKAMTVIEALQWANNKLKTAHEDRDHRSGAKLDSPMLDAEVLLSHILSVPKSWLFTHMNDSLKNELKEAFEKTVERRAAHEPIAYIIGEKEFYKRSFAVNRFTLIPRPDTEVLVDLAIEAAKETDPERTIFADVGTGSGAIATTLALESGLPVMASDNNGQTLKVAKENIKANGAEELVDVREGDLIDPLIEIFQKLKVAGGKSPISHLVICANLPYLTDQQWETTQPEVRDYEPKEALAAGKDGLDAYWKFFRELLRHRSLFPLHLSVLIEIDPAQTERVMSLIRHNFPNAEPNVHADLNGLDRVIVTEI